MNRAIKRTALAVYESLSTPVSLSMKMLLEAGEWDQIAMKAIDPSLYLDSVEGVERYRRDCQAVDLLRKYDKLPTSIDKQAAAVRTFYEAEMQCFQTNRRLSTLQHGDEPCQEALRRIFGRAAKWIARVLGPLPDAPLQGRFGPGTAFELKGSGLKPCTITKCWTAPALTPASEQLFWAATRGLPLWERRRRLGLPCYVPSRGNRFTTVPKDGKTDRGICIEPGGNLWLQLGVGGYLKDRLSRLGLHLNPVQGDGGNPSDFRIVPSVPNAQDVHRTLAREGSIHGRLSTIDLSSASDTVAYELVRMLLPDGWFRYLARLRSPVTFIDGRWVHLSKFSSMGNGFTFELETLLFASLAYACGGLPGRDTFVYGDDIICPTEISDHLLQLLRFAGFTPNTRKTFTTGLFRESCGGDFFCGVAVRPYQLKNHPVLPHEVAGIQRELVLRGLPWKPLLDLVDGAVLFGPIDRDCFAGPRRTWKVKQFATHSAVRVYKPSPLHWGVDRFSDHLDILAFLAGEPDPRRPTIRGCAGTKTQLVWCPPAS